MTTQTWMELESFTRTEAGVRASKPVTASDRLEDDLDLTGDDADEFMGKFFERFPVKPGDYEFSRYFSEEGFNLLAILAMPFSRKQQKKYDKQPLTVGMLERAINLGVWDSEKLAG
ncbi:DUF1493 family protein [Paraburkholderia oxyphila]|uniref:DUF1493 family protein n=1 Tax=Paraburkholderia oxyphila TaxID=614212 RepID=UPI0004898597|nr:DUF1493 family protein [Paraburkholderia oxyphila]